MKSQSMRRSVVQILGTMLLAALAWGQSPPSARASTPRGADTDVVGWWAFDDFAQRGAYDRAAQEQDISEGRLRNVRGALGNGLKCDGLTSCIIRKAAKAPKLAGPFAIEAWVAPQTYPWNWCPIVAQNRAEEAGYYFGLDADGHVGLLLAVDGQWKTCVSESSLPLMKWSHVVGTFDPRQGITVYINGVKAGFLPTVGTLQPAEDTDLRIARNHKKRPLAHIISTKYSIPAAYSFDGLLDEIKIRRGTMTDQAIHEAFVSARPPTHPDLKLRRLPSGPKGATRFGAFYEQLKYDEGWDALWRGQGPDVVVGFDSNPCRLVFWRGVSYAPCWVSENGKWFCHEFMERSPAKAGGLCGCCESMSDKRAQYSHAKTLENNDARTVVYWRYSPCDIRYVITYADVDTGWGDWAEEYHTIYPDGVAVRKVVLHSGNFKDWYEWCQSLPIMQPGEMPEDVLNSEDVLSLANMEGQSRSYAWPSKGKEVLPGANIQVVHYKSRYWPFLVLWDRDARIWLWGAGREPDKHSKFSWWKPLAGSPGGLRRPQRSGRRSARPQLHLDTGLRALQDERKHPNKDHALRHDRQEGRRPASAGSIVAPTARTDTSESRLSQPRLRPCPACLCPLLRYARPAAATEGQTDRRQRYSVGQSRRPCQELGPSGRRADDQWSRSTPRQKLPPGPPSAPHRGRRSDCLD